jgi:hypothetical protein
MCALRATQFARSNGMPFAYCNEGGKAKCNMKETAATKKKSHTRKQFGNAGAEFAITCRVRLACCQGRVRFSLPASVRDACSISRMARRLRAFPSKEIVS